MDNKEFDHLMGDKLRPEQSFDFQESDWNDLSQKLNDHDRKKRLVPFWFWKGLLGIAALGIITFLWTELENTKKTVQILQSNSIENNLTITDTIYKKVTIIEYDTIRKTTIVEELEKRALSTTKVSTKSKEKTSILFIKEKTEDRSIIISEGKENCNCEEDQLKNIEESFLLTAIKNEVDNLNLSEINQTTQKWNRYESINLQSKSLEVLKTIDRELILPEYQALPIARIQKLPRKKRLGVGLLGMGHLAEKQSIPGYTPDGFFNLYSKGLGLRTELELTNNFSLTGDIIYQELNFITNNVSHVQDLLITEEIPTGLDTVNVDQSNFNYALGIKYFLRKHRKLQPYTSIKLQAVSSVEQKISGLLPGAIYLEPELYESIEKKEKIDLQSIETALGFQYRLLPNLSWQAEGNYYFYLDKKEDQLRSNIGLKTSLLFHF